MVLKKSNYSKRCFVLLSLAIALGPISQAQIHTPFLSQQQWIGLAEQQSKQELYVAERYAARMHLQQESALFLNTDPVIQADRAHFLASVAGLKIKDAAAVAEAKQLIKNTAQPVYKERAAVALAQYYFHKGQWSEAISYYEQASIANLNNDEVASLKFEMAYCYFNNLQFEKAEEYLTVIKDLTSHYHDAANYYFGLLAYNKNDYKSALKSFEQIESLKEYAHVVPYYIAEIYYFEGAKDKAFEKTKAIIAATDKSYYDNEAHLLAAQCLFEAQKYKEAIPYFEFYYSHVDKIRKQDMYKMAFSYYQTKQWEKAIEPLKQLSTVQDVLGQTAMYFLGDCYLKTNDKRSAKSAFSISAGMPYNSSIVESALLLSGKLALELGYSAEGSAQLKKLFTEYPNTPYKTEAANILSEQLLGANNYKEAYEMLVATSNPSKLLLQKSAYGYALQQLQQNNWADAQRLIDESLRNIEDRNYAAAAYFWKAELEYHFKNYAEVISYDNQFLAYNNSVVHEICADASPQNALMTMGYAALNQQQFEQARGYFAQAQNKQINHQYSTKLAADAILREADAAFLQKDYVKASELYSKSLAQNGTDADYARFQNSTLLGLQGKTAEQAELLLQIVAQKNPESKYKYEAHYALGDMYLDANKYEDAIAHFQKVNETTAKHLAVKAMMKIAFAYQQADNDDKAIATYTKLISLYPGTDQKNAALEALKNLYVSNNQPDSYVRLLKENGISNTDNAALDSVYYASAETQYAANNFEKAVLAMDNYIKQYPQGIFATKANFYKAESLVQLKQLDSAEKAYEVVLANTWTEFTEPSAKRLASIAYAQNDYPRAQKYYSVLRDNAIAKDNLKIAYKGLMLTTKKQSQHQLSSQYADTLLSLPDLDEQSKNEALLVKANEAKLSANYDVANGYFKELSSAKTIEVAAEANYNVAEILLLQGNIADAEKACTKAIQQTAASSYWNTKSYLLMADIFVAQKDYFNAKATLQSVVKNVKLDNLKKEAAAKLEQVKVLEKGKSKLSEG